MYQLFASIIVCQIVYIILIAVAKCLRFKTRKSREYSPEMATNMTTEAKSYILTGLEGQTSNSDSIMKEIDAYFDTQKIQATVRSVYIGFTSQEVGLSQFQSDILLGFVRLTGANLTSLGNIDVAGTMTLHSLPEDAFGWTEAKLQPHITDMIPRLAEKLVQLYKELGIKITKEQHNIWLVGDSWQINIARNFLNRLCSATSTDFMISSCDFSRKPDELCKMIREYQKTENEVSWNHLTSYLQLAFYLNKLPCPNDAKVFIMPRENCFDADLIFQRKTSSMPSFLTKSTDSYKQRVQDCLNELRMKYKPVYLTDHMPSEFRNILETVVEQMHKPTLFLKCPKRHWSCYMFSTDKVAAAETFVKSYLRVNTYKPLDNWWSELPEEILTTRQLQLSESDTGGPTKEVKSKGIVKKEGEGTRLEESGTKDKPTVSKKPVKSTAVKKKYDLLVKTGTQELQYLYARHVTEMQNLETEFKVKLTVDTEDLHITAEKEEVAQVVEEKLKKILESAKLHTIKLKEMMPSMSPVKGVLILNCMEGTSVSATGPQKLVEALEKALTVLHKEVHTPAEGTKPDHDKQTEASSKFSRIGQLQTHIKTENNEDEDRASKDQNPPLTPIEDNALSVVGSGSAAPKSNEGGKTRTRVMMRKGMSKIKSTATEGMKTFESQKTGILVKVGYSDITKLQVDAIVNAANNDLDHIGGVARAIAEAAGPEFDDECQEVLRKRRRKLNTGDVCVTGAGRMPAKKVLHAVGPAIDDYDEESEAFDVLRDTFNNCLNEAQNENCESVAIPAISSGAFGIPEKKVAKMACQALQDFLESDSTSPVRLVIFTDVRPEMIQLFEKEMTKLVKNHVLKLYVGSGSTL